MVFLLCSTALPNYSFDCALVFASPFLFCFLFSPTCGTVLVAGDQRSFTDMGMTAVRMTEINENYFHQHQDVREVDGVVYGQDWHVVVSSLL